jgi:hypothetical protein
LCSARFPFAPRRRSVLLVCLRINVPGSLPLTRFAVHCDQDDRTLSPSLPAAPFVEPRINAPEPVCQSFPTGAYSSKRLFTNPKRLPVARPPFRVRTLPACFFAVPLSFAQTRSACRSLTPARFAPAVATSTRPARCLVPSPTASCGPPISAPLWGS